MRLLPVRFTVRRMMTVVAIAGVLAAIGNNAIRCHRKARDHRTRVGRVIMGGNPDLDARIYWDEAMYRKYERAVWRPWEPLLPDTPEPGRSTGADECDSPVSP